MRPTSSRSPRRGRRPAGRALAVLGLIGVVTAGCTDPDNVLPDSPAPSTDVAAGQPSAPSPRDGRTTATESHVPEILQDLNDAVDAAEQYWAATFAAEGATFRPVRRVYAYVPGDGTTCGGRPNAPRNASYCRVDDTIAFDVRWTARAFEALGDAFVYYLIAHEYAHAVQARLANRFEYTIQLELQADCYAGANLGDQIRAGALQIEEGDIDELRRGLRAVGDPEGTPWFDQRAHGTPEQRIEYFGRGFDDSLDACP